MGEAILKFSYPESTQICYSNSDFEGLRLKLSHIVKVVLIGLKNWLRRLWDNPLGKKNF